MKNQYLPFKAVVPEEFGELMIQYWMKDESLERDDVISTYRDESFSNLEKRIKGKECSFKPDIGYSDNDINGTLCLEVEDNNFCIPVSILESAK